MAVLDDKIQEEIFRLENLAYERFQENKIDEYFKLSEEAWSLYPEPKNNWNEAYNSAMYIVNVCFSIKDYDRAKKWLNEMINVNNNLHQSDEELAHYIGKYHFDTGNYEEALMRFKEVVQEAGFRYFEDEDPKYLDFYRNPEKYMQ
ncbi:hypothetical protein [Bacteroides sp. 224]|uniref:hypothetical protein n=1 Tax=Bacteroides sp. 224 TaxID=2302936 RepID=UPI0013D5C6C0|nr:hypothetical protein [Bacteroides sp. 224]NDV66667.1 hypothetical protein [Bacteroides sp. 224]